ncbi:hypothetical protein CUJ83_08030 [Methanocella sp. CWC-04]|uniref:Uncharacterized protein n=1 Tax=Methanooceanicella nereidis TaxID=2052831 RepID=A0AAP2W777_9EURY|nr:hypothetical protein [Methanocella sp. CWC-04]MCD1294944.1 hypothetical protein [Methanocella sp. CWC-04]
MEVKKPFAVTNQHICILKLIIEKYYPQTIDKLYVPGAWRSVGGEELWKVMVRCISAVGRSAPSYELIGSGDIKRLSIKELKIRGSKHGKEELIQYVHHILADHKVRYCSPHKDTSIKAAAIVKNLYNPLIVKDDNFVLFHNMERQSQGKDPRYFLIDNVYFFGIKLSSQYLMETGYSQDYMSFDWRLKRIFSSVFDVDFSKILRTQQGYVEAESVFREEVCPGLGIKTSDFDSVMFWNYYEIMGELEKLKTSNIC